MYNYLFKFIVIGDTSVGKSCLLLQFLEKKFKFDHDTTIGVEFGSKIVKIGEKAVKLQIWDTAGQETFKSITRSYYRGSIGAILVYDISNRESFKNLHGWIDETKSYSNGSVHLILVGNKSDLDYKRVVTIEEGCEFAKKNNMLFLETSAKTGQNVDQIFLTLSEYICKRIDTGQVDPKNQSIGIKMGSMTPGPQEHTSSCC